VNQASDTAQPKPVLNQEGFQRLLAAAYLLQVHTDRQPSTHQLGANHASFFSDGAIVQKRTPSVMIRDRQPQPGQRGGIPGNQTATEPSYPTSQVPFVGPTVPHIMKVSSRRLMSWRSVEPLAIAIVFCMMIGLSIHRLSAIPDRTSLASEVLDEQNVRLRPAEKVTASSQPVVDQNSRQSPRGGEADIVAKDIIIRHQKRIVSLPGKPGVPLIFGEGAAADTVVRYGSDVKMWSIKSERATLNRLSH
jgi:hypothetical protein